MIADREKPYHRGHKGTQGKARGGARKSAVLAQKIHRAKNLSLNLSKLQITTLNHKKKPSGHAGQEGCVWLEKITKSSYCCGGFWAG
jgi:hypothetical protein